MILVGTASWTDKSLIDSGLFYPPTAKTAESRLKYYAQHFPMVEVDSSYYAIPVPQTAQLWAQRTPPNFVFNVKAFRLFTGHQTQPKVFPKDIQEALGLPLTKDVYHKDLPAEIQQELWRRFFEAVEPLRLNGKLGALHFQFAMARHLRATAHHVHDAAGRRRAIKHGRRALKDLDRL